MKNFAVIIMISCLFTAKKSAGFQDQPVPKNTYVADSLKNTNLNLAGQYQFMLSRSKTVNGYKLINPYRLASVWKSVNDTLNKERLELTTLRKEQVASKERISQLQNEIQAGQNANAENNERINEIKFIGIPFDKTTYSITVWSIICLLAISLMLVIKRSSGNLQETKDKQQMYGDLTAEFQAFKAKANEKERKLARELQDERNRLEELRERGKS